MRDASNYIESVVARCPHTKLCSDGLNLGVHNPESYREVIDEGAAYAAERLWPIRAHR